MKSLYGYVLEYLTSDGKCDGCEFISCARFPEALYCPYTGRPMKAVGKMMWVFTDAPDFTRSKEKGESDEERVDG